VKGHDRGAVISARRRYIARRLRMCRRWGWDRIGGMPQPGRLSKWNLVCTCRMCRYWRLREKYRAGRAREAAAFRRELLQEMRV
jgi:hypothetical protein